ncbi:MAG: hypothetical protein KGL39_51765 [Patescibacteria group bacterium]|nr:hypothetical protein [Patescibacteria group bacterium]
MWITRIDKEIGRAVTRPIESQPGGTQIQMASDSVTDPEEGRYLLLEEEYRGAGRYKVHRYLTPAEIVEAYADREPYTNYIVARELQPVTTLWEW